MSTLWMSTAFSFKMDRVQQRSTTGNYYRSSSVIYKLLQEARGKATSEGGREAGKQNEDQDGWESRWVKSDWKEDDNMVGEWNYTSGKWNGDANDKGTKTSEDYKFYAISAEYPEFSNKDKTLVFQFTIKHEQKLDFGGGYMKLLSGGCGPKEIRW